eukprot:2924575-Prymnesium_polylepis.1
MHATFDRRASPRVLAASSARRVPWTMGTHLAPCHGCLLLTACAAFGLTPYVRSRVPLPAACAGYGLAPYAWSR